MLSSEHPQDVREWLKFQRVADAFPGAAEKGRLLAAQEIATNPEARQRVEATYGLNVAKRMYPEAYRYSGTFSGVVRFLDGVRRAIPW